MSKVGVYYNDKTDDVVTKRMRVCVCKMRLSLSEVCNETLSDVSQKQKNEIDNSIKFNPRAYYEIHDDIESKSKKIIFLDDNDEMVKNAEKLIIPIINKLHSGISVASRKLDELLNNNDLKIRISPVPEIDAGCEYIPPQSSEKGTINLGLSSGCFASNVMEDDSNILIRKK